MIETEIEKYVDISNEAPTLEAMKATAGLDSKPNQN